ncbi:hypothetical protein EVA_21859 [gut metagenome]|uniref:Uncharacterized protein n=1 Tax=gut metagenome TaxID=749906 RepID=J9F6G3_9ZZZZ
MRASTVFALLPIITKHKAISVHKIPHPQVNGSQIKCNKGCMIRSAC